MAIPDSAGMVAGSEKPMSTVKRPVSITIIAWVFVIAGVDAIWNVIASLGHSHISLNFGVLFVPLGIGLLRLRPRAHIWAVRIVVLYWMAWVLVVIFSLIRHSDVRFFDRPVEGWQRIAGLSAMILGFGAVLTWMTKILTKHEELFTERE